MNTTHYAGLFESTWKRKETILTILTSTTALLILLTSGWLRVWAGGVPHTMQTQAVIVLAMCLPRKTSLATIIAYVAVASFAPIKITLTPGIFGITGGYFFGFVLATMYLGNKKTNHAHIRIIDAFVAQSIILGSGVLWISLWTGLTKAITIGLTPFLLTDSLKLAAAIFLARAISAGHKTTVTTKKKHSNAHWLL